MDSIEGNVLGWLLAIGVVAGGVSWWLWPNNSALVLSVGLFFGGIILLIAEALLPTHGILGIAGLLCFGGIIGVCFYVNRWFGLTVFASAVVCSPFIAHLALRAWMKSPIGKRLILNAESPSPTRQRVEIGQVGVAVTEMRPLGECDFRDMRLEAASELGIIPAGQKVRVVGVNNGRPVVRPVES